MGFQLFILFFIFVTATSAHLERSMFTQQPIMGDWWNGFDMFVMPMRQFGVIQDWNGMELGRPNFMNQQWQQQWNTPNNWNDNNRFMARRQPFDNQFNSNPNTNQQVTAVDGNVQGNSNDPWATYRLFQTGTSANARPTVVPSNGILSFSSGANSANYPWNTFATQNTITNGINAGLPTVGNNGMRNTQLSTGMNNRFQNNPTTNTFATNANNFDQFQPIPATNTFQSGENNINQFQTIPATDTFQTGENNPNQFQTIPATNSFQTGGTNFNQFQTIPAANSFQTGGTNFNQFQRIPPTNTFSNGVNGQNTWNR